MLRLSIKERCCGCATTDIIRRTRMSSRRSSSMRAATIQPDLKKVRETAGSGEWWGVLRSSAPGIFSITGARLYREIYDSTSSLNGIFPGLSVLAHSPPLPTPRFLGVLPQSHPTFQAYALAARDITVDAKSEACCAF